MSEPLPVDEDPLPPRARTWPMLAEHNIERWGEQEPAALALALAEEQAEIADEILRSAVPAQNDIATQAFDLLRRVRAAGLACQSLLELHFEDEHGVPLPPEKRPEIAVELDREDVLEEVADAGPLAYQLAWALEDGDSDA